MYNKNNIIGPTGIFLLEYFFEEIPEYQFATGDKMIINISDIARKWVSFSDFQFLNDQPMLYSEFDLSTHETS